MNITEIETLFGLKKIEASAKSVASNVDAGKTSRVSQERGRNIELIYRKLRLNLESLRRACYEFDERYLDYGMVMSLLEIHPLQKEMELFERA